MKMRRDATVLAILMLAALAVGWPDRTTGGESGYLDPLGKYARYRIVLSGAGEREEDIVLNFHSRDGRLKNGWATAGRDLCILHEHPLQRQGDRIGGTLTADIGQARYEYELDVAVEGGNLAGRYTGRHGNSGATDAEGKISGELELPAAGSDLEVTLGPWDVFAKSFHIRNPWLAVTVLNGKVAGGEFHVTRRFREGDRANTVDGGELTVRDGRLVGTVLATAVVGDADRGQYAFAIDLPVTNNHVRGQFRVRFRDETSDLLNITGFVRGAGIPKGDAVLNLTLDRGIEGRRTLYVMIPRRDGRFIVGTGMGGNSSYHKVEPVDLKVEDGALTGALKVTLLPDGGWFPAGDRTMECTYKIDGRMGDAGAVTGTFAGTYGRRQKKEGAVSGGITPTK